MRRSYYRRQPVIKKQYWRINERIDAPEILLIDEIGTSRGVMSRNDALVMAKDKGYDLVEVNPTVTPPVVKMLHFKHFQYQQEKQLKKQRIKQKVIDIKCIRLSLRIGNHDLDTRIKQVLNFLEEGHKVRIELLLKGRERQHANLGREVINKFVTCLGNISIDQELSEDNGK